MKKYMSRKLKDNQLIRKYLTQLEEIVKDLNQKNLYPKAEPET
jgi:hypothetical protein